MTRKLPRAVVPGVIFSAFVLSATRVEAQQFAPDPGVDAVFAAYDRPDAPGCAVGVYQDGVVRYARGNAAAGVEEMRRGWELVAGGLGAQHPTTRAAAERIAAQYEAMGLAAPATEWRGRAVSASQ